MSLVWASQVTNFSWIVNWNVPWFTRKQSKRIKLVIVIVIVIVITKRRGILN